MKNIIDFYCKKNNISLADISGANIKTGSLKIRSCLILFLDNTVKTTCRGMTKKHSEIGAIFGMKRVGVWQNIRKTKNYIAYHKDWRDVYQAIYNQLNDFSEKGRYAAAS